MKSLRTFLSIFLIFSPTCLGLVRIFKVLPNRENILQSECYSEGGQLAVIENSESQRHALSAAVTQSPTPYVRVRIGAQIFRADEGFTWIDGGRMVYSNWGTNQPDNFQERNETCVEMIIEPGDEHGKWNDVTCDVIPMALCELTNEFKYRIFPNRMESLSPLCFANGGRLAEINSREDQDLALSVAREAKLLGVRHLRIGARLTPPIYALRRRRRIFMWPREEIVTYTQWAPGEPNFRKENESCLELQLDHYTQWNDVNCEQPYVALCKIVTGNNTVMKLVRNTPEAIQEQCSDQGGRLMTIRTSEDQIAAATVIRENFERHKIIQNRIGGARDIKVKYQRVLVGARRLNAFKCPQHRFAWVMDELPLTFTNWAPGQPSVNTDGDCVVMKVSGDGFWRPMECGKPSLALCQYPEVPPPHKSYQVIGEDGIDDLRGFRFWEQQCRHRGGLFAHIHNETEQLLAEKAIRRARLNDNDIVLLGGSQTTYYPKVFHWLDGTLITYTRWKNETRDENLNCITLVTTGRNLGQWRVTRCRARNALCQFVPRD